MLRSPEGELTGVALDGDTLQYGGPEVHLWSLQAEGQGQGEGQTAETGGHPAGLLDTRPWSGEKVGLKPGIDSLPNKLLEYHCWSIAKELDLVFIFITRNLASLFFLAPVEECSLQLHQKGPSGPKLILQDGRPDEQTDGRTDNEMKGS